MALRFKQILARIFHPPATPEPVGPPRDRRSAARETAYQTVLVEWQDLEKGSQALAGILENRSAKGFGIRASRLIPRGKTIMVYFAEEAAVKAVVRHCAIGIGGFYLGVEVVSRDKRRSDREPMCCAAKISCTREGRRDDFAVIIRDASETGVQLESYEPLAPDEVIEVTHLGSYREGTVTYCNWNNDCYRIGVQFIGPAWHVGDRGINSHALSPAREPDHRD